MILKTRKQANTFFFLYQVFGHSRTLSCHAHPASVIPAPLLSFPRKRESSPHHHPFRDILRTPHDVRRIHGAFNRA